MIKPTFVRVLIIVVSLGIGAAHAQEQASPATADAKAYRLFAETLESIAGAFLPSVNSDGLIGRNREWGGLYSPRFQMGAGFALRVALVAERPAAAARAFRAIEVVAGTIRDDGYLPSRLPASVDATLSDANIASAAAFFLGDACLGLRALAFGAAPVAPARQTKVAADLSRAIRWLHTQTHHLKSVDRHAPNRLLFNARAFQACSALMEEPSRREKAQRMAAEFVEAALALQAADGHFKEGGGFDTSYQGVALSVGEEILLAGFDDNGHLKRSLNLAAQWLVGRVGPEGRVDSTGNARTCSGGEVWFGRPKRLSVRELLTGLIYAGVRSGQAAIVSAAHRLAEWVRDYPGANPCFTGDGA